MEGFAMFLMVLGALSLACALMKLVEVLDR